MNDLRNNTALSWNKRLKDIMDLKGYTQTKFANILNKMRGNDDNLITQKTVSRWMKVGEKSSSGIIGFPKYENMILIANVLKVNVGYLTGETDMETFEIEQVSEYLNLNENAIKSIIKATGTDRDCLNWGYNYKNYRDILNRVLSSTVFHELLISMNDLNNHISDYDSVWKKAVIKIGEDRLQQVSDMYGSEIDYQHDPNAPKLSEEQILALNLIGESIDSQYSLSYTLKVDRYETSEILQRLMDDIFPRH